MDIQTNPTPIEVERAFRTIGLIATGRTLDAISVGTSETAVRHYLGRVPQYWFELAPKNGAAAVKESATTPRDSTFIYLIASSAVTADLWIW